MSERVSESSEKGLLPRSHSAESGESADSGDSIKSGDEKSRYHGLPCIIIAVVLCVLLSTVSLVFSITLYISKVSGSETCLPCKDLTLEPPQFSISHPAVTRKHVNGEEICCASDSQQLPQFYNLVSTSDFYLYIFLFFYLARLMYLTDIITELIR